MKNKILISLVFLLFLFVGVSYSQDILKLATTTSIYETGLLDSILPEFEKREQIKMHIISVGTGKAMELGKNGDVDVLLVHDPKLEEEFVASGYGVNRREIMYNDFVIVGPESDPARIKGLNKAQEAFKNIYDMKTLFISRGDNSGTHNKEKRFWQKLGVNPNGAWYWLVGQGMSQTLRIADEKQGYCLVDRSTYLANAKNISLKILLEGDDDLLNIYSVIAINPAVYKHVNYAKAKALVSWLVSSECQKLIGDYRKNGYKLYVPSAK